MELENYITSERLNFKIKENFGDVRIYIRLFKNFNFSIEIELYKNTVTIYKVDHDNNDEKWTIACRYKIRTLDDFDYLLYEGLVGPFFKNY